MKQLYKEILTDDAVEFVDGLIAKFESRLKDLLALRKDRQKAYDHGGMPDFKDHPENIRESDWKVAKIPDAILDRRVEITGPPDRKMVINALNSGANVYMADLEDSLSPTWKNVLRGQLNLRDAVNGTITYEHPKKGTYTLNDDHAVLFVRPRGLHLVEKNWKGSSVPACLVDFGLFMFHNAKTLWLHNRGPYFYIPKLEDSAEARWWNDVFVYAQKEAGIPQGTIRATVLLETLPAAFQMEEILYELRDHSAGLNCGRWDYIFSYIKTFRNHPDKVLGDRGNVTMQTGFMKAYSDRVIAACHKRGAHAMGGMAAQIPIRHDPAANELAMAKVTADKVREVNAGHDGTWVAHPGLVSLAKEIFDAGMPQPNQIESCTPGLEYTESDRFALIEAPEDPKITRHGVVKNIIVGIQYLAAWLRGEGCVPLYDLMEDAATAEISRAQLWQWFRNESIMIDGVVLDNQECTHQFAQAITRLEDEVSNGQPLDLNYLQAISLFREYCFSEKLPDFLTEAAYQLFD